MAATRRQKTTAAERGAGRRRKDKQRTNGCRVIAAIHARTTGRTTGRATYRKAIVPSTIMASCADAILIGSCSPAWLGGASLAADWAHGTGVAASALSDPAPASGPPGSFMSVPPPCAAADVQFPRAESVRHRHRLRVAETTAFPG